MRMPADESACAKAMRFGAPSVLKARLPMIPQLEGREESRHLKLVDHAGDDALRAHEALLGEGTD